jgi:hypothetical protein
MLLRVENLGPLREAEVDLSKELILLTGPNSTGKTYVAWSVYGLLRDPDAPGAFRGLVDEILATPEQEVAFERVAAHWPTLLEGIAAHFASRLHLCFAAERQHFADVKVTLTPGAGEPQASRWRRGGSRFDVEGFLARITVGAQVAIQFFNGFEREGPGAPGRPGSLEPVAFAQLPAEVREALAEQLGPLLARVVMRRCWPACTLLPTERTAVDLFARELSIRRTELVSRAVEAELDPEGEPTSITRDVGRYPWPIQDSLRMANDLVYVARGESEFADLAVELEGLLGGAVSLSKEGAIGFSPKGGTSPAIGIHLTSSVVKSLVRLVFFFRHLAVKGDLLMIDEPELNLHPDNQRRVTRVLAKAVNRGLRLMMSTHSDYVLRELNNLILLQRDTLPVREVRAQHGYTEDELLAPAKVGVYFFNEGTAKAVPVTEDGFEVQTIEDEINRMNAVSQEIYAALHE